MHKDSNSYRQDKEKGGQYIRSPKLHPAWKVPCQVKVKLTLAYHDSIRESGGTAPLIPNLDSRQQQWVSLTPQPLWPSTYWAAGWLCSTIIWLLCRQEKSSASASSQTTITWLSIPQTCHYTPINLCWFVKCSTHTQ